MSKVKKSFLAAVVVNVANVEPGYSESDAATYFAGAFGHGLEAGDQIEDITAYELTAKADYKVLSEPLGVTELRTLMDGDGHVSGVVEVELGTVIREDHETFLDTLSMKLTGSELLMDVNYDVVGHAGDTLHIRVEGDASEIVKDEDEGAAGEQEKTGGAPASA